MCPYSAYLCFDEIEHHRTKPCRAGIIFLFFSFSLVSFFFYIRYTRISTLPPQNHRQNALAMLYSKGSAPKKKRGKKRKNSLDPPSPHIPPTSPLCTFMSNANERKIQGSAAPSLQTDSSSSSIIIYHDTLGLVVGFIYSKSFSLLSARASSSIVSIPRSLRAF